MSNEKLPSANEYIEKVYGTANFARTVHLQDTISIIDLMNDFADKAIAPLQARIDELERENDKLRTGEALGVEMVKNMHLEAKNERLRGALNKIMKIRRRGPIFEIAKEALKGGGNEKNA